MGIIRNTYKNKGLFFMALPGIAIIFMFYYMPMFGLVVAFKNFNYSDGVWGSAWVGFENFKLLAASRETIWRLSRNTIGYWILFTTIGTLCNVTLAILLNEIKGKWFSKISHTIMIFPTFISWIAVTFIVTALLHYEKGMINHTLQYFGGVPVQWYFSPDKWPAILLLVNLWKNTGYGSILYLSALTGIDPELYEAARIDGANRWMQVKTITIPMLIPVVSIMTLMSMGGIMTSNTGLFYQVTKNIGMLYPTTQTIDAYVMNTLTNGSVNFGMTSAVTLFQSVVGCVMVIFANLVVRRMESENALF